MTDELILTALQGPDDALLEPGRTWVVPSGARIGRRTDCDVVVADPTVSRVHARVWCEAGTWWIENLASANGLFVEGAAVEAGARARLPDRCDALQLGGALFAVAHVAPTAPVIQPLAHGPVAAPQDAVFRLVRDGDSCDVRLNGRFVPMKPLTALVFWVLASRAPAVVHEWDLHDEVGRPFHLAQAVSDLRRALRRLVDEGWLDAATVRAWVREVGAGSVLEGLDEADVSALSRRWVLARRGHGYVLLMPAGTVSTDVAG